MVTMPPAIMATTGLMKAIKKAVLLSSITTASILKAAEMAVNMPAMPMFTPGPNRSARKTVNKCAKKYKAFKNIADSQKRQLQTSCFVELHT